MRDDLPITVTIEVRDRCLCLHLQRAARAIGRRFDDAFRPLGLSHQQYSLLVSLNRPQPPKMGDIAEFLAMDRTTLTANLKPLERRGLVVIAPDPKDRRSRRLTLTDAGRNLLVLAVPIWRLTHDEIDNLTAGSELAELRQDLVALTVADQAAAAPVRSPGPG